MRRKETEGPAVITLSEEQSIFLSTLDVKVESPAHFLELWRVELMRRNLQRLKAA